MEFVLKQIIEDEKMEHRVPSSKEKATWTPLILYLDIVYLKKLDILRCERRKLLINRKSSPLTPMLLNGFPENQ